MDSKHSYNLAHTNPLGYRRLIEPRNSLAVILETTRLRLAAIIRRLHLDFTLPTFLLGGLLLLLLSNIWCAEDKGDSSRRQKIEESVPPVALYVTIVTYFFGAHSAFHQRRRERASDYVQEWRSGEIARSKVIVKQLFADAFFSSNKTEFDPLLFNTAHAITQRLKENADGIEKLADAQTSVLNLLIDDKKDKEGKTRPQHQEAINAEEDHPSSTPKSQRVEKKQPNTDTQGEASSLSAKEAAETILSFMEQMGQDVKMNVVDSHYLKDYFYNVVITYYELLRKYIEYRQYDHSCRIRWCNFVYLAQRWEGDGFVPTLPDICRRPLVLTESDIIDATKRDNQGTS